MTTIVYLSLLLFAASAAAFQLNKPTNAFQSNVPLRPPSWPIAAAPSDDNTPDFSNFNPFDYKANRSNSAINYPGTQISLRKTRMQELTNELLNCANDSSQMQEILKEYQDFLLEPLEDDDAVLDPDSIYATDMSRAQRYKAYRASMEERVSSATNPTVRTVLETMRDFVLSFE